ncbi:receptor-like protein EIX2 [Lycium barbarum]|uniref:receptor-like protein EIX2 n=1 Tax=Lycium barbarum TaxID=112863 RepID=UPI00293EECDE|nr:receptor-like protein EIX2 [Lycium barbarum]
MEIGGWNIGPLFPMWLQTQKMITQVDISGGGIQVGNEDAPWLMYLGSNKFSGPLPLISTTVAELDLSNNSFSKGLSHFLCEAKNGSYKLEILNLGGNYLSEEIPDCWMNWLGLTVLIMRDNNLIGGIPRSMKVLTDLRSLDFRRNRHNGPFSSSSENCTKLNKIDLAENGFVGQLPAWLGMRFPILIALILRSNKFDGEFPQELCHLKDLQILDLANNTFGRIIPRCISNFSAMVKGKKVLDDDMYLYGYYYQTPERECSGMIPLSTQLQSFDPMSLQGNKFYGLPLVVNCNLGGPVPNVEYDEDESDKNEVD